MIAKANRGYSSASSVISKDKYQSVADFYSGKSVFITGSTGFLGKVYIEKLLHSCPKLDKVYLLIREKKGISADKRITDLFDNPLFKRLKSSNPDFLKKVVLVPGDLSLPHLGISPSDEQTLIDKVSIVYHAGATVRFHEPLPVSININFDGTRKMLELSQRMKNIEAFVYVSTAYAQGSAKVLVETTYPSPAKVEDVYKFIEEHGHDNDEVKKFIGSHFGTYAFAKSLSEAYIAKNHGKVPAVIIRPSAVTSIKDGPVKGWLDNWFGASGILFYINEGAIRVLHGEGNNTIDFTPVDYVSNLSIISALRAKESNEVQVFNSTSSSDNPVNWDTIYKKMKEEKTLSGKNKFPYLSLTYVNSKLGLQMGTFFLQITPAVLADLWLKIKGKDPKYLKIVSHAIAVRNAYEYFTSNMFVMRSDRTRELHSSLSPEDREEFQCDPTQIRWPEYLKDNMHGIYKYLKPPKMT
ncbi:fatty acyl-CoA reductase 1-like [Spodoptera litura]|uniref:Fatty acyl-CoA reductase n=1 Tax=Spodoptera litura TaxID=69820 RepID=A0A9J7DRC6_SPOLT|nr:fatty acyl-CoA reductase 1-like [Spodoptera litura]